MVTEVNKMLKSAFGEKLSDTLEHLSGLLILKSINTIKDDQCPTCPSSHTEECVCEKFVVIHKIFYLDVLKI
jgi:hypothetical protein